MLCCMVSRSAANNWYYLQAKTGSRMYGEQKIDGKWYYFDRQTGIMAVGIQTITMNNGSKKTVCYGADGAMCYGEQKIDGKWYLFDYKTGGHADRYGEIIEEDGLLWRGWCHEIW